MKEDLAFYPLRVGDGTVFVGPTLSIRAATETWPEEDRDYRGDLAGALRRGADLPRLRSAFTAWGLAAGTPLGDDARLCLDVAEAVGRRWLAARFLPRFVEDPRGPGGGAEAPFRRFQLSSGFPSQKTGVTSSPREPAVSSRPSPRSTPAPPENDFQNESAQAKTLRDAAKSGAPFCEICAASAKSAA